MARLLIAASAALAALATVAPACAQTPVGGPAGRYPAAQLDELLAPIALYPDGLLAQILMAAGYPLEIVEANRWRQSPENTDLQGMQLAQALQQQPWDPSVKSLTAFPQVLATLDANLDWTEALGAAFIAQQADVMDRVQQLRHRAEAARTLVPTPQQAVTDDGPYVQIAPTDPGTVYVPVYDPNVVYGPWADQSPYSFDMGGYFYGAFVGFAIIAPLWGWNQWDWHHHGLGVIGTSPAGYSGGPSGASGGAHRPSRPVPWRHDASRRGPTPNHRLAVSGNGAGSAVGSAAANVGAGSPAGAEYRGVPGVSGAPAPGRLPQGPEQRSVRPAVEARAPEARAPDARAPESRAAQARAPAPEPDRAVPQGHPTERHPVEVREPGAVERERR